MAPSGVGHWGLGVQSSLSPPPPALRIPFVIIIVVAVIFIVLLAVGLGLFFYLRGRRRQSGKDLSPCPGACWDSPHSLQSPSYTAFWPE